MPDGWVELEKARSLENTIFPFAFGRIRSVVTTVTEAEEVLLPLFGSEASGPMVAVVVITVLPATESLTVAENDTDFVSPTASVPKVTIRLLPAPPQAPPSALQLTKVVSGGSVKLSVTSVVAIPAILLAVTSQVMRLPGVARS